MSSVSIQVWDWLWDWKGVEPKLRPTPNPPVRLEPVRDVEGPDMEVIKFNAELELGVPGRLEYMLKLVAEYV